jgi:hypothetical protein
MSLLLLQVLNHSFTASLFYCQILTAHCYSLAEQLMLFINSGLYSHLTHFIVTVILRSRWLI